MAFFIHGVTSERYDNYDAFFKVDGWKHRSLPLIGTIQDTHTFAAFF